MVFEVTKNGIHLKPHSKRVEKMWNHTRNEWRRCETTLETSGEDEKPHSKRVEKIQFYTRNECKIPTDVLANSLLNRRRKQKLSQTLKVSFTLETSEEDVKLHSKRVEKMWNSTPNEWRRCETPLQTSGEDVKLHSEKMFIFYGPKIPKLLKTPPNRPYFWKWKMDLLV